MKLKYVMQVNPVLFVQEIVESIKEGFYIIPSNEGWCTESTYLEINLFKTENPVEKKFKETSTNVREYDKMDFLIKLQEYVVNGYIPDFDTFYWDRTSVKSIEMNMDKDLIIIYTREDLENVEWEEFKTLCKKFGVSGRDRQLMITRVLKAQEEDK